MPRVTKNSNINRPKVTRSGRRIKYVVMPDSITDDSIQNNGLSSIRDGGQVEEERKRLRLEEQRIAKQRAELDQRMLDLRSQNDLMEEVRRLQEENERQRRITDRLVSREPQHIQGEQDGRVLGGIINHLNSFNVDIKVPKFTGEDNTNPREFINDLERYFELKHLLVEQKILVVHGALEGRAKIWLDSRRIRFRTYEDFKTSFLQEFYSVAIRIREKNRWSTRRYKAHENTLQTYYLKQAKEAQYFEPKLTDYEINYSIIQQMPVRVRENLVAIDFSDNNLVETALAQLDLAQEEREREKRRNSQPNNNDQAYVKVKGIGFHGNGQSQSESNFYGQQRQNNATYQYNNRAGVNTPNAANFCLPNTRYPPPTYYSHNNTNFYQPNNQAFWNSANANNTATSSAHNQNQNLN